MSAEPNEVLDLSNPTKACRHCATDIPLAARKCVHCDSWQNWRGTFDFSVPVLSLLLAILTVVFSSGREFYEAVTYRPDVDVIVGTSIPNRDLSFDPSYTFANHLQEVTLTFVNNEEGNVIVDGAMHCVEENKPYEREYYARIKDGDSIVSPKSRLEEKFTETQPWLGTKAEERDKTELSWRTLLESKTFEELKLPPPGVAPTTQTCVMTYTYRGKSYSIEKQHLMVWVSRPRAFEWVDKP